MSKSLPKTPEQLAKIRQESIEDYNSFSQYCYDQYAVEVENPGPPPEPVDPKFTCDGCPHAPTCEYVYDFYNTNGDCLALK